MSIHASLLVRDSLRYWRRKPWQALVCVFLLAIGSAAVAILWTVTDVVVRKPLPFPDSHELYGLQSLDRKSGNVLNEMSIADFRDFQEQQTSFTGLFGYRGDILNFKRDTGETRQLFAARVTRDFAKVLEIRPEVGRLLERDDFASDQSSSAVISYDLWQEEFGGADDAVGQSIWFDKQIVQVVGVMPKSYNEPAFSDVWLPFPDVSMEYFVRDGRYWRIAGRLKQGVPLRVAQEEVARIAEGLAEQYPVTNTNRGVRLKPLQEIIIGDYSTPILLIFSAVSLVMFATCLNLANLQLISGLQRRGEVGIRQAIGESDQQSFARVLMESTVICFIGCGLGWLIAWGFIANIENILPAMLLPRLHEISMSGSLGWTILAIALVASASFGLLPAIQTVRGSKNDILKSGESRHGLSAESRRSRSFLLALQVAVAVVILNAALLVVYEYRRLNQLNLGFERTEITMLTLAPSLERMADLPALSLYYEELRSWLESQPGVLAAASASSPPLWGFDLETSFQIQGRDLVSERNEAVTAYYNSVSHDFHETMGIRLASGRAFTTWDNRESERVALVNEAFVSEYLQGADPLGQLVQVQSWMEPRFRKIVGVVGDYAHNSLTDPTKPQIFVPASQTPWIFTTLLARSAGSARELATRLEVEMKQEYPELGLTFTTLDDLLDRQLAVQAVMYALFVGFGAATILLSLFGIGSQMAFNVSERSREWGIRLALGANVRQLNALVLRNLVKPLGWGFVTGLLLFAASYRALATFGQSLSSAFVISSASLLIGIAIASAATTWLVSNRITRANPQDILKSI